MSMPAALPSSAHALALMLSPVHPEEGRLDVRRASKTPQRLASSRSALCCCSRCPRQEALRRVGCSRRALPAPAARARGSGNLQEARRICRKDSDPSRKSPSQSNSNFMGLLCRPIDVPGDVAQAARRLVKVGALLSPQRRPHVSKRSVHGAAVAVSQRKPVPRLALATRAPKLEQSERARRITRTKRRDRSRQMACRERCNRLVHERVRVGLLRHC